MKIYAIANQSKCGVKRICIAHTVSFKQSAVETCIVAYFWLAMMVNKLSLIYCLIVRCLCLSCSDERDLIQRS